MKKISELFHRFIFSNTETDTDAGDLSALLRSLILTCIILYFLLAFPFAAVGNVLMCLLVILSVGLLTGALVCTFEDRTKTALLLYIGVITLDSCVFSFYIGWSYFFMPMVFSALLLAFFTSDLQAKQKIRFSFFLGILTIAVSVICYFLPRHTEAPFYLSIPILVLNVVLSILSITQIAFAYYIKYAKSAEKIIQYNRQLEHLAKTDALTSLWNRRAMNEHLSVLVSENAKQQKDFSLAIIDIDFFKKVNDEYGHGMGDFVLKSLSYLLKTCMNEKGKVARWGGEEFLLTFEDMDFEEAYETLEAIRARVEKQVFAYKDVSLNLTITGGIEEYRPGRGIDFVLTCADEKLYEGKMTGRNKIVRDKEDSL